MRIRTVMRAFHTVIDIATVVIAVHLVTDGIRSLRSFK